MLIDDEILDDRNECKDDKESINEDERAIYDDDSFSLINSGVLF